MAQILHFPITTANVPAADLAAQNLEQSGTRVPRVLRFHPRNEAMVMFQRPVGMQFSMSSFASSRMSIDQGHARFGQEGAVEAAQMGISHRFRQSSDVVLDMCAFRDTQTQMLSSEDFKHYGKKSKRESSAIMRLHDWPSSQRS